MKFSAAIFDLDGTLLDSMSIWETVGEDYLIHRNLLPEKNLKEILKPMSLTQAAEYLQKKYLIPDEIPKILEDINHILRDYYFYKAPLKKGAAAFLEFLSSCHIPMCMTTATDRSLAEPCLRRNQIASYFCHIYTCTEEKTGKDNPAIYEKALSSLNTSRQETFVFEDAFYAISTAKSAGFPVVGVYDYSSHFEQSAILSLSDFYISDFLKAPSLLRPYLFK